MNFQLSETVVWLITLLVIPGIAQAIKLYKAKTGKELTRQQITLFVFVVSLLGGALLTIPDLDQVTDFWNFVEQLIARGGVVFGYATLIYNLILGKIFEGLSLTTARYK